MIPKIKSALKRVNPRSPKVIIAGFLIVLIPLLGFLTSRSQKQVSSQPQWESYEDQVKKGKITPAGKILEVVVNYKKSGEEIVILETNRKNGYAPSVVSEDYMFTLQIVDKNQQVVSEQPFSIPKSIRAETFDDKGIIHGKDIALSQGSHVVVLPWDESGTNIRIKDKNGKQLTSSDLENMKTIDNKPNFRSIEGDELLNNPDNKINLNFLVNDVFAQTNDSKFDVVFIGDKYTDMGSFHADVEKFASKFLSYEPFNSRASQIAFHYIDNTTNLECAPQGQTIDNRLLVCNFLLVEQEINNSGVPNDAVNVIVNTPDYGGSGGTISVTYNGSLGPDIMVHEVGHSFGKLLDEYAYEGEAKDGPIDNEVHGILGTGEGNCYAGEPPAGQWDSNFINKDDYRKRCDYLNWYASSQTSIMHTVDDNSKYFNPISEDILNKKLDELVGQKPLNTVSGRVLDAAGKAVGGVKVSTCTFGEVATDSNGNWKVENVKDGQGFCARVGNACPYDGYIAANNRSDSPNNGCENKNTYEFQIAGKRCGQQGRRCGKDEDLNDRSIDSGYDFRASSVISGKVVDERGNGVGGIKVSTCTLGDVVSSSSGNWQLRAPSNSNFCVRVGDFCPYDTYRAINNRSDSPNNGCGNKFTYEYQISNRNCGQGETCGKHEDENDRNIDSGYDFKAGGVTNPTPTPTFGPTITPTQAVTIRPTATPTPEQPHPTFVCGGSKDSICVTPTSHPHPTKEPIVTNAPLPTVTGEPILNTTPIPEDPCLNPQDPGFRQKLSDWVNSIKEQVNQFIQGILGNPTAPRTERPNIKPPCINR